MKKPSFILASIVILVLSLVWCGIAMAEYSGSTGNVQWTLSDAGHLKISGNGSMPNFSISSNAAWRNYKDEIVSIEIEAGVTSIGNSVFYNCPNLRSVIIPNTVKSIGDYAFSNCHNGPATILLPDSIESIGDHAFYANRGMVSINLPEGLVSIGDGAFLNCNNLESIVIPSSVTSIGAGVFAYCNTIPSIVVAPGNQYYCAPNGVLYNYDQTILIECPPCATEILLPNTINTISEYAFYSCKNLTSIIIPESVITIEAHAFVACSGLTSIVIPYSVESLGASAFHLCSALQSITFESYDIDINDHQIFNEKTQFIVFESSTAEQYAISKSIPYTVRKLSLNNGFKYIIQGGKVTIILYNDSSSNVVIPESLSSKPVARIYTGAFSNCSDLVDLTLSDTIELIDNNAIPASVMIHIPKCNSYAHIWAKSAGRSYEVITHQHIIKDSAVDPTCVNTGLTEGSHCDVCGDIIHAQDTVAALGHTFVVDEMLPPTDTQPGLTEGSHCSVCGMVQIEQETIHPLVWSLKQFENGYTIEKYYGSDNKLTIPTQLNGINIIGVADNAFDVDHCPYKIFIPKSVESIGTLAFGGHPLIYCYSYSEADFWSEENGFETVYTDNVTSGTFYDVDIEDGFKLLVGCERVVQASIFPCLNDVENIWSSSIPEIVSIDQNGKVHSVYPGTSNICLSVGGVVKTIPITAYCLPENFDLSTSEVSIVSKDSFLLEIVDIVPRDSDINVLWTSSNTSLATVDQNGRITAKRFGDVTITATQDNIVRTCLVHICQPVSSVSFVDESYCIVIGKSMLLSVIVVSDGQEYANQMVSFTSSNDNVVSVNSIGVATAHGYGTATITASSSNGCSSTCEVDVIPPRSIVTLPSNLSKIESEAFVKLQSIDAIRIPENIISIAPDSFDPDMTLVVPSDSRWVEWGTSARVHDHRGVESFLCDCAFVCHICLL